MFNPIKHWQQKQQKRKKQAALIKMFDLLQAEEEMVINDVCRQVERKLYSLPPEEALKLARSLRGEA